MINSSRKYIVTGFETGSTEATVKEYSLEELLTDDKYGLELTYSLQDDIDCILDLDVGEVRNVDMCRKGTVNSIGLVKRVS